MKLNNKLYDVLKWITLVVIPALATAYVGLAAIWGWPYADAISKTACVVCALLGALLGISTAEYRNNNNRIRCTSWLSAHSRSVRKLSKLSDSMFEG